MFYVRIIFRYCIIVCAKPDKVNIEVQVYGRYTLCNKEQHSTRDLVKEREEVRSL